MLVQIHSPEAFKLGLKSRWCEEFVSYWSAKPCASLAATVRRSTPLLARTLALYTSPQVRSQGGINDSQTGWELSALLQRAEL